MTRVVDRAEDEVGVVDVEEGGTTTTVVLGGVDVEEIVLVVLVGVIIAVELRTPSRAMLDYTLHGRNKEDCERHLHPTP